MHKSLAFIVLCCTFACNDSTLTSPTEVQKTNGVEAIETSTGSTETPTTVPSCFDSLGITRSGITHRVDGSTLFIFVPATNADYVNVWTPNVNDTFLGRGPVNDEFSVNLPGPGEYKITLAIERREGNGVCQYDGHSFKVTVKTPPPPDRPDPIDVCPNIEGNQSTVPEGLVKDEAGNCVEPEPECEQVWIVDQQAYDEVIVVTDKEAYDEEVETCVPQDPLPGIPIVTGFVYKLTGANSDNRRELACEAVNGPDNDDNYSIHSPAGVYGLSNCIPGNGAVDSCVFSVDLGPEFDRKASGQGNSTRVTFDDVDSCNITVPGEPIPQPDKCTVEVVHHDAVTHEEVIHHDEVGHFIQVCED